MIRIGIAFEKDPSRANHVQDVYLDVGAGVGMGQMPISSLDPCWTNVTIFTLRSSPDQLVFDWFKDHPISLKIVRRLIIMDRPTSSAAGLPSIFELAPNLQTLSLSCSPPQLYLAPHLPQSPVPPLSQTMPDLASYASRPYSPRTITCQGSLSPY